MNVKITIKEQQVTEFTYEVENATSLVEAEEIALHCHHTHFSPKPCYLYHVVPHPKEINVGKVEVS